MAAENGAVGSRVAVMQDATLSTAASIVNAALETVNGCLAVRTKAQIAALPGRQEHQLDRDHRTLAGRCVTLEQSVLAKRAELEECLIRVEEVQAAIAHREYVLAHPARPRTLQAQKRASAAALYASLARTEGD